MFFHKITWDEEHPVYTYHFDDGKSVTLRPGDKSPDGRIITKEDIRVLVSCHNSEVRNNLKHSKAHLTERMKKEMREWEDAHPGETAPGKWNASIDVFFGEDNEMDRSQLMLDLYNRTHKDTYAADRLFELIGEMTEKQRRAFVMFRLEKMSLKEIAEELGCSQSAVSRAVSRAEEFIRKNF